jgi:hypothetical protein
MKHTFVTAAELYPPVVVRLAARKSKCGPPLTTNEIADRAGMTPLHAWLVSCATSWDQIEFGTMLAFTKACGADFSDARSVRRLTAFFRTNPKWGHLKKHPDWHSTFKPLLKIAATLKGKR